jgi:CheY-like chemotaxis protein
MHNRAPILIVEDNEDHLLLLRHALNKAGIVDPVRAVPTGEDAIAYLEGTGRFSDWHTFPLPSLVLLDLKLPGISGFDVLKWIRQHPGLKKLRVAMLTSSDLAQEVNLAYELGANMFLTKPVDLDRLVEMMKVLHAHWVQHAQAPEVSRALQADTGNHPS